MLKKLRIGFVGAGNLAGHLTQELHSKGHSIDQIISSSALSAENMSMQFSADSSTELADLNPDLDLVFLTVPDDKLQGVIKEIADYKGMLVHTSGSFPIEGFCCHRHPHGVFYPLQTFSPNQSFNWNEIPIFIEGSDSSVTSALKDLAETLSSRVMELSSPQRLQLHVSAVWACNFTNHMIRIASDILEDNHLDPTLINPLIKETFEKAMKLGAKKAQTGPAIRQDFKTIQKHLDLLNYDPDLNELYHLVSRSIQMSEK